MPFGGAGGGLGLADSCRGSSPPPELAGSQRERRAMPQGPRRTRIIRGFAQMPHFSSPAPAVCAERDGRSRALRAPHQPAVASPSRPPASFAPVPPRDTPSPSAASRRASKPFLYPSLFQKLSSCPQNSLFPLPPGRRFPSKPSSPPLCPLQSSMYARSFSLSLSVSFFVIND